MTVRIFSFIFGLAVMSFVPMVLASTDITSSNFSISLSELDPVNSGNSVEPGTSSALALLTKVADLLLYLIPIIAAVSLIFAGYYYILSSGDSEKASRAKTIIKWNTVAILLALFSYMIIKMLAALLSSTLGN